MIVVMKWISETFCCDTQRVWEWHIFHSQMVVIPSFISMNSHTYAASLLQAAQLNRLFCSLLMPIAMLLTLIAGAEHGREEMKNWQQPCQTMGRMTWRHESHFSSAHTHSPLEVANRGRRRKKSYKFSLNWKFGLAVSEREENYAKCEMANVTSFFRRSVQVRKTLENLLCSAQLNVINDASTWSWQ